MPKPAAHNVQWWVQECAGVKICHTHLLGHACSQSSAVALDTDHAALPLGLPCASEGVPGSRIEFLAYRIIYQAVHAKHGEILQLLNTLKKVKREVSKENKLALNVCSSGNPLHNKRGRPGSAVA